MGSCASTAVTKVESSINPSSHLADASVLTIAQKEDIAPEDLFYFVSASVQRQTFQDRPSANQDELTRAK